MIVRLPSTRIWIWVTGRGAGGRMSAGAAGGVGLPLVTEAGPAVGPFGQWSSPPWPAPGGSRLGRGGRRSRAIARASRCGSVQALRWPCLRGRGRLHLGPVRCTLALRVFFHPLPARRGVGLAIVMVHAASSARRHIAMLPAASSAMTVVSCGDCQGACGADGRVGSCRRVGWWRRSSGSCGRGGAHTVAARGEGGAGGGTSCSCGGGRVE